MSETDKAFEIYTMTLDEVKLLQASTENPNLFFEYWFKKPDADRAFQLDYNMTDPWQVDYCMAQQTLIVAICGISTGKTLTVGLSACYHAVLNQDFKFLNIGYELKQSEYMYDAILEFSRGTRFEKLISKKPRRPNPQIVIEFKVGNIIRRGTLDFMSAGEKNDAMNVFSYRGDIINVEEAGRFTNLSSLIAHLTTRLTGGTASGRPYMGRLSLISNPHENPELWAVFDQAKADPEHCLVFNINTSSNKNTTEAQLAAQLRNMNKEEQERFLTGKRPEGRGLYFGKDIITRNASAVLSERLLSGYQASATPLEVVNLENGFSEVLQAKGSGGWVYEDSPVLGVYNFKMPRQPGRVYLQVGDPGIGNPPHRNSPAIMVFDVTEAPKFSFLVAMWWGFGNGSIQPFVSEFLSMIEIYGPEFAGVDSTSTQKNMAELMNLDYIYGKGKSIDAITGLDFSGGRKDTYLVGTRLSMEQGRVQWPDVVKGLSSQLRKYDRMEDRAGVTTSKLAQDLVSCFCMGVHAIRTLHPFLEEDRDEADTNQPGTLRGSRKGTGRSEVRSTTAR